MWGHMDGDKFAASVKNEEEIVRVKAKKRS
jgi:hypothetical protein